MTVALSTEGLIGSGAPADTTPPTVTIVSPTPGVAPGSPGGFSADWTVARATPIVLTITDAAPGLAAVVLVARMPGGVEEVVFRDGAFRGVYVGSTVTGISGGYQLSVQRLDGWPSGNVVFDVVAVDAQGNVA